MTNGSTNKLTDVRVVASEALAALDTGGRIAPFSAHLSAFDFDDAYRITAAVKADARDARRDAGGTQDRLHESHG
jgi:hypothetical protein